MEIRAKNGGKASALEKEFRADLEKFVLSRNDSVRVTTTLAKWFPNHLGAWYSDRLKEGWEYVEATATVEISDYGEALWSGRSTEAVFVKAGMRLRNRSAGNYKNLCFYAGYINDTEFSMIRVPLYAECEGGEEIVRKWKIAQSFKSGWNAE